MSATENTQTISVNRALSELKRLEQRISKKILNSDFVGAKKGISSLVKNIYKVEDFNNKCKGDYASCLALISRRNKIKQAVVLSNANTKVKIDGVEYTVAEAIERKVSIDFERELLEKMKQDYRKWRHELDVQNMNMQDNLEKIMETLASGDKKGAESNELVKKYREDNGWALVNPLDIERKIIELEEEIDGFESEVDFVLTESNAITMIEVVD